MFVDMPEEALREYVSSQTAPSDFDRFWSDTIAEARSAWFPPRLSRVESPLTTIDVYDVTFAGFGGQEVKAWLRVPSGATGPLPTVVQYVGYGGGRGHHLESLLWASAGYAHFHMDTRGQGSTWSRGATPDEGASGPQLPGMMTRGIDSPETYYYRRLTTDAVLAVDAARALEAVDTDRVAVLGGSQGGGLALAAAGLVDGLAGVISYVPFLCDFPRAIVMTDADPYHEITRYLAVHREKADAVARTLSYFDSVNHAARASAPVWFSAALMDSTCPPSTVFAAYNAYAGPKEISVWPFNGHEGGGIDSDADSLEVLARLFPR